MKQCSFHAEKNVGDLERVASTFLGTILIVFGLSRRRSLGWLSTALGSALVYRGVSSNCQLYQALGLSTADADVKARVSVRSGHGVRVENTTFVQRPPEELYRTWRNFENLPHFMSHLESVSVIGEKLSRWVAKGPAGRTITWDAEIINEHPNEMIAWRSLDGAAFSHAGTVRFEPVQDGTDVRITLEYEPVAGIAGAAIARLFHQEPGQQIKEDMIRFKQMMESSG
jgi:uncharacterized membrane protein